jgi:hypothetical protein
VSKAIGSDIESKPAKAYDLGLTGLPLAQRAGITLPTPENLQAVADNAAAKRARTASEITPQAFGYHYGIPRDLSIFLQRLETTIIEQGRRIAQLEAAESSTLPRHMRDVEHRG